MDTAIKFLRSENTISSRLLDELVMLNIEKGKYFSFNPVATRIWEMLEVPMEIDQLCNLLLEEYEVEAEQCRVETKDCLDELIKIGLVQPTD